MKLFKQIFINIFFISVVSIFFTVLFCKTNILNYINNSLNLTITPLTLFLSISAIQIIVGYIRNSFIRYKSIMELEQINSDTMKMYLSNFILMDCCLCHKPNKININLSDNNIFECNHCHVKNELKVEFSAVLVNSKNKNEDK